MPPHATATVAVAGGDGGDEEEALVRTSAEELFSQPPKVIYTSRDFTKLGLSSTQKLTMLLFLTIAFYLVKLYAVDKYFDSEQMLDFISTAGEFTDPPQLPLQATDSVFG
ncbi:hypothetical protein BASA81_010752 [Batrachochytrium salamandrivorans]|nr:hypothetical protein BASA81_010752 [Batrachochytrium salamandrivorans]